MYSLSPPLLSCRHGWYQKPSLWHYWLSLLGVPRRFHPCLPAGQGQQNTWLSNARKPSLQRHWAPLPLGHRACRTAPHTLSQYLQLSSQNPLSGKGSSTPKGSILCSCTSVLSVTNHIKAFWICNVYYRESSVYISSVSVTFRDYSIVCIWDIGILGLVCAKQRQKPVLFSIHMDVHV